MKRILVVTLIAAFVLPASAASAAVRFASPSGGTTEPCGSAAPCSLDYAIEKAEANDDVVVTGGTYDVAEKIKVKVPLTIRGERPGARPRIVGASGVTVLEGFEKVTLADLTLESHDSLTGTVFLAGEGSLFERVEAIARGESVALRPGNTFTVRNSLLVSTGPGAAALFVQGTDSGVGTVRNVTAVASGSESVALAIYAAKPGTSPRIDVVNTIASGETAASALATTGAESTIAFDHSDLPVSAVKGHVTVANSAGAVPTFRNPAAGDYHVEGSALFALGVTDPANGPLDLDGGSRTYPRRYCGGESPTYVTDIGAYQSSPSYPLHSCAGGEPPETLIARAKIKPRKGRAKFWLGAAGEPASGFECQLVRMRGKKRHAAAFKSCGTPTVYRHLKPGRYVFKVRALNVSGVDATPAERRFRIKPPLHRPRGHQSRG